MSLLTKTYYKLNLNRDSQISILIQRADRLGDVVFILPVIETLNHWFPQANIDVLTSPIGKACLDGHSGIRTVYEWPQQAGVSKWRHIRRKRACRNMLRACKYDLYISLWNEPVFAWLGKRLGIPIRMGDASNPSLKWLYTHPISQRWTDFTKHQIDFNMALLKPFGIDPFEDNGQIARAKPPVLPENEKKAKSWVKKLDDKPIVVIFSGTGGSNAPIPDQTLATFAQTLVEKEHLNVVICGENKQESPLQSLKGKRFVNLLGKTSIAELMGVIGSCDYYVGADTGPAHLAAAFDKPMVFFCGRKPNAPSRFGPVSRCFRIIRQDYSCPHFCQKRACDSTCFSYVTPERLHAEFLKVKRDHESRVRLTDQSIRSKLLLHSIRVMYLCETLDDYYACMDCLKTLQQKGLIVFPYLVKKTKLFHMLSFALKKNINVIQSPRKISYYPSFIQGYVGTIKQYVRPIYVQIPFVSGVKCHEYLNIYQDQWERQSGG